MSTSSFEGYRTPCGHTVTVRAVVKQDGRRAGKWRVQIRGPKVTQINQITKTLYTSPAQSAVYEAVAEYLANAPAASLQHHHHQQQRVPVVGGVALEPPPANPAHQHQQIALVPTARRAKAEDKQTNLSTEKDYDKYEKSPNNMATCRVCGNKILIGQIRAGVNFYNEKYNRRSFLYYHGGCHPNLSLLNLQSAEDQQAEYWRKARKEAEERAIIQERQGLREKLRQLRTMFSSRLGIPAYVVFCNKALDGIVLKLPQSKPELLGCYGIAEKKYESFGPAILVTVHHWINSESTFHQQQQGFPTQQSAALNTNARRGQETPSHQDDGSGVVEVATSFSCEEIVNQKFRHAQENGYMVSID